jgi:predicted transcriptional regulator
MWYHFCVAFTVRTDEIFEDALDALGKVEGLSRQEIVRRAVLERYERSRHVDRVAASTTRMTNRWGDVLERLGSE